MLWQFTLISPNYHIIMRKITQDAVRAFKARKPFKRGNTEVKIVKHDRISRTESPYSDAYLFLHGNMIAKVEGNRATVTKIQNAGYMTNVTKERLNGLDYVNIVQKNGVWYLNGKEWNGQWTDTWAWWNANERLSTRIYN
tara:strand:- start:2013 stop:2432 length:420 start_codon:yes stop_codon:yes gene_type:complete